MAPSSAVYKQNGSSFHAFARSASSKQHCDAVATQFRDKYPKATHHCYAWRCFSGKLQEFSQDDGEPSGSAGRPILNALRSAELVNTLVMVIRYYGGTNLGVSGLIQAYGQAAGDSLSKAKTAPLRHLQSVEIYYPYSEQNTIELLKNRFGLTEMEASYGKDVKLTMECHAGKADALREQLTNLAHKGITATFSGAEYR